MYQQITLARIILAVGVALLIFSLVLGWISFAVPDWLQFYERTTNTTENSNLIALTKFGLWYKCVFSVTSNDFNCASWNNHVPSFVRVVQVFIPLGLSLGCLALLFACIGCLSRRVFVSTVLFSGLLAFLSFIFLTIGVTVFATESLVYVDRLRLENNINPRRWGMWLIVPNLVLAFLASICFIVASILNWCDYRSMQVSGILNHSVDKYADNVFKAPSDSNMIAAIKRQYPQQQDYPNAFYQINGLTHNGTNPMQYPSASPYAAAMNQAYQQTPPGLFGYSRGPSPTMNNPYQYSNMETYPTRHHLDEDSESDEPPRMSRSRRRSRSRNPKDERKHDMETYPTRHHLDEDSESDEPPRMSRSRRRSRSRRYSEHRSRSRSPRTSTTMTDNYPKQHQQQPQFVPVPVPYYQPPNNPNGAMSYLIPQAKQQQQQQLIGENPQSTTKINYNTMVSKPNQPVYTIAYRPNTTGNLFPSNILTGPPAATYVSTMRHPRAEVNSLCSDDDDADANDNHYQLVSKRNNLQKINVNEAWAWRKL